MHISTVSCVVSNRRGQIKEQILRPWKSTLEHPLHLLLALLLFQGTAFPLEALIHLPQLVLQWQRRQEEDSALGTRRQPRPPRPLVGRLRFKQLVLPVVSALAKQLLEILISLQENPLLVLLT